MGDDMGNADWDYSLLAQYALSTVQHCIHLTFSKGCIECIYETYKIADTHTRY